MRTCASQLCEVKQKRKKRDVYLQSAGISDSSIYSYSSLCLQDRCVQAGVCIPVLYERKNVRLKRKVLTKWNTYLAVML